MPDEAMGKNNSKRYRRIKQTAGGIFRVILPFISQGGSQIFVMYILTGLVLSIQRNKSIAMYGTDGGMENAYGVYGRSFEIARLKITVEKV